MLDNVEQAIPQQLSIDEEIEFKSNLTRILIDESVPKQFHEYIINHQLGAIKNLLKEFTTHDPKLVTYGQQKIDEDKQRFESVGIPEEIYLNINLRLAREDRITRGILKFIEAQDMHRKFKSTDEHTVVVNQENSHRLRK